MTNSARRSGEAASTRSKTPRISPWLAASAGSLTVLGIATGLLSYLHRSPIRAAHVPGTSAWPEQLIAAGAACVLYAVARWRRGRQSDPRGGRLLLLAPLGRTAASRLTATMRHVSWRSAAALAPLALIGYSFWRVGEQVTGGLDPNFTVNAWGGPTYLGAMACHYLDAALIVAAAAWLLDQILLPAQGGQQDTML